MSTGFEIIPAIDLIDGKCVRLTQGDYSQKTVYNENPVEVAKQFEDLGITRLHVVDLDGAKAGKIINHKVLEAISNSCNLKIDFGGGVKTVNDIDLILNSGATFVTIGSMAVKNKDLVLQWIKQFGADKFFIGIDVKGEMVATSGWLETSNVTIYQLIEVYLNSGFNYFFSTDISKDGMLQGISAELYKNIVTRFPQVNLVASGGVANVKDVKEAKEIKCSGIIIGKAIYENKITKEELKQFAK